MRLHIPTCVYDKLMSRFETLSVAEDNEFLMKYLEAYGVGAYQYLMRTYRSAYTAGRFLLKASPSNQTKLRLLKLIPTVMSPKERFELFEEIIDYNEESNAWRYAHRFINNDRLDGHLSFSFDEWISFGESQVKARINEIGVAVVREVNYKARYDFTDIEWLLEGDITAFCQLKEDKRKAELRTCIDVAISEVDALSLKWRNLQEGTVSSLRSSEMKYSFSLAGLSLYVTIFDAKERKRQAIRKKINDLLPEVGCLTVIVLLIILTVVTKK